MKKRSLMSDVFSRNMSRIKKKKCFYCGKMNEVMRSKADDQTIDAMWSGDDYPFRCIECGELNYNNE